MSSERVSGKDMVWLRLCKEHQRRADACAAKHREELRAGKYGPVVTVRLIPPGYPTRQQAGAE